MKNKLVIFTSISLIFILTSCAGSISSSPNTAGTNITTTQSTINNTQSKDWQNEVTHAWVVAWPQNWNADAEDDGIRVWIELLDKDENIVRIY